MSVPSYDLSRLPGEWWEVQGSDAEELERELAREVSEGHALHGASVQAVAVRRHLKEVVYWVPAEQQWAFVHLTHRAERDPRWPGTFMAPGWDEIVAELRD